MQQHRRTDVEDFIGRHFSERQTVSFLEFLQCVHSDYRELWTESDDALFR